MRTRAGTAHPRVCGENAEAHGDEDGPAGSSPRVRGKRLHARQGHLPLRLIPACAGKTTFRWLGRGSRRAHPRVCGENSWTMPRDDSGRGSSPRVRGKPAQMRQQVPENRLIPACAGKTQGPAEKRGQYPAHPRVCGENANIVASFRVGSGSSPRVRGKQTPPFFLVSYTRLIPACAGKTAWCWSRSVRWSAHPRVCGENFSDIARWRSPAGSSPRVRGKRPSTPGQARQARLIPACAGKTMLTLRSALAYAAHPRVCGENARLGVEPGALSGSSPRVRGKPRRQLRASQRPGAHPRVCGENKIRRPNERM